MKGFKGELQCVVPYLTPNQSCARSYTLRLAVGQRDPTYDYLPMTLPGVPELFVNCAFRVQCTNVLGSKGATEAEREAHIGWQSTV
jgi:hypothetical protein